ncbi:MAG: hypothetical protein LC748_16190 [Thermomicrobia bacterium]|nr:hypothetical protein [Thermomicrobia bacterium]
MRILAISGSLQSIGTITTFVRALMALVAALRGLLRDADGVLICTPEYAYGMPGSLPFVRTKMDADGAVSDPATEQALRSVLDALARAATAHRDDG